MKNHSKSFRASLLITIGINLFFHTVYSQTWTGTELVLNHNTLGGNGDYTALYRADTQNDKSVLRISMGDEYTSDFQIGYTRWQDGIWQTSFNLDGQGNGFYQGWLGVGNTNPESYLHIGTSNLGWSKTVRMILEPPQHTGAGWEFSVRDDEQNSILGIGYGAEQFTINHDGKVGIGITNPVSTWGEKLHIYSPSSNTGLRIGRGDGASGSFLSYSNSVLVGSGTNHPLILMTGGNGRVTVKENGLVGIGNESPQALLHVGSGSIGWGRAVRMILEPPQHTGADWEFSVRDEPMNSYFGLGYGAEQFTIHHNGNVGIGSLNPTQKLTVNGTVYSTEVKVDVNAGTGPDYVFEPTYQLPSLTEIENYIKANKHLPEVPSAKEMETNGINLSEMNMLLLKKVEELTLYILDQNKTIEQQKVQADALQSRLLKIEKVLNQLENK